MIEALYETDELPKAVADKLDMDHSRACVDGHWVFSIISGDDSLHVRMLTRLLVTLSDPSLSISLLASERSFIVNILACFTLYLYVVNLCSHLWLSTNSECVVM